MPVTLRQLRYFQALIEHGSFSRAAESVHVSQPALSLQIRELEASLGGSLVERESRGILLTPLGREAHDQTLRILDETLLLENLGQRFEAGPLRVSVGVVSTLAPYLLSGILSHLHDASPRIELEIREAPGQDLVSSLLAGRLDAAIVSLPLGLMELPERELFEDHFVLAGRADRLASIRRTLGDDLRPSDLARADIGPLLTLGDGHCLADQVLGASLMWRTREVRRGAESLATLSRLVASGAGLTLMPETAALAERAAEPDLSFLRFAAPEPSRRIGLTHRVAAHGQKWIDVLADAATSAGIALTEEAQKAIRF
ncbi:MAG: LysR substrate-binding domain-containing protein [Rhodospirillales bacterium]|nr:LysR substrate-binding domain-containing protein [Rhodospirillales bacterium]MDE0377734.1 LysR substrate-binding domain-containing protein [Rhodospirillales bacterium]